jgi:hypothetical protein
VVGLAAAETMAWAAPAQASNGNPVLLGTLNTAAAATEVDAATAAGNAVARLADPHSGIGVFGTGSSVGMQGVAGSATNSDGVHGIADGSGTGVVGIGGGPAITLGNGVRGVTSGTTGAGVIAEHINGGAGLRVLGAAEFSRSGTLTIKAGAATATMTGVPLTSASLILATLQQKVPGVYVQSAVPDVSKSSFTIHLSKATPAVTTVAWFIVN